MLIQSLTTCKRLSVSTLFFNVNIKLGWHACMHYGNEHEIGEKEDWPEIPQRSPDPYYLLITIKQVLLPWVCISNNSLPSFGKRSLFVGFVGGGICVYFYFCFTCLFIEFRGPSSLTSFIT